MKQQSRTFEVFTITQTAKLFGYKSTKTLYRLLNNGVLDEYTVESISGRVFLQLDPKGCIPLEQKIKNNIQRRVYNVIKKNSVPKYLP